MKLCIGETIARLRREKSVTQEQLADAIGVSAPAVSKWERGQSYPDIALLLPLARYFDVDVDTLLGEDKALSREKAEALGAEAGDIFNRSGFAAGLSHCAALEKQYPTDDYLKLVLATSIGSHMILAANAGEEKTGRALEEKWLACAARSKDTEVQLIGRHLLACIYITLKKTDEAEALLTPLTPEGNLDPRQLLPTLYITQGRYEDAEKLAQQNLFEAVSEADRALMTLTCIAVKSGDLPRAKRFSGANQALQRLFELTPFLESNELQQRAMIALAEKDDPALLDALERLAESYLGLEESRSLSGSIFFDKASGKSGRLPAAQVRAGALRMAENWEKNPAYAHLRANPRFEALLGKLRGASSSG